MDDPFAETFAPLIGVPCWGVERGQGSMLSFHFGEPRLVIREPYVSHSASAKIQASAARRLVKPVGDDAMKSQPEDEISAQDVAERMRARHAARLKRNA